MVMRKLHPKKFFTKEEKERIVRAIREAERKSSGEIRVYLEHKAKGDSISRAEKVFEKLGMTGTKHRNGVLIYFSLAKRAFVILGDSGIHEKVGEGFWQEVASTLTRRFSEEDFLGGLLAGIERVGEKLKKYFPHEKGNLNELPDEVEGSG